MWTAAPERVAAEPAPQTVVRPRTKSTPGPGSGCGRHRSWFGVASQAEKSAVRRACGGESGAKGACVTEGRTR